MKCFITLISLLFACTGFGQSNDKIITAGSAMTETVCALGKCAQIIASDRTSTYPESIKSLPSIGYRSGINAEGIISLQPTLVIAEGNYVPATTLSQIESASIRLITIDRIYSLSGTKVMIDRIATALNEKAQGIKLIANLELQLAASKTLLKNVKSAPRVLCIYNRGTSLDAAGTKTFSDILPYVGAINALSNIDGYKAITTEAIIEANPDYILFFESGLQSIGGVDGASKLPGIASTIAGAKKQIVAMDGVKLSNFGPRFGEAVKELILLLHPELINKK